MKIPEQNHGDTTTNASKLCLFGNNSNQEITVITQKLNICQIIIENTNQDQKLFLKIFRILDTEKISADFIMITDAELVFSVNEEERDKTISIMKSMRLNVITNDRCAKIVAEGPEVVGTPFLLVKILESLNESGIKILQLANSFAGICCLVFQEDMEKLVIVLQNIFLNVKKQP